MPRHIASFLRVKVIIKPLERPFLLLLQCDALGVDKRGSAVVGIDKERSEELFLAFVEHHSGASEVFSLKHLDGDRRLACGVHHEFLAVAGTVQPFIGHGDVPYAV